MSSVDNPPRIGVVGYGEVGRILGDALCAQGLAWVGAWDLLFADETLGPPMVAAARAAGVVPCTSLAQLLAHADIVISAVTAANAFDVASESTASIRPGTYFFDLNSASPETKVRCAAVVDAKGARYVEAGVMASVPPYGIAVPMVVGGEHAGALAGRLVPLGFCMEVVAGKIGIASAIKMCRSIIIKGMEAIVIESYTTARRHGVEARVLESLRETYPGLDWERQGAYFFSRVAKHGRRRADEMREAAHTVEDCGFEPFMAAATSDKQAHIAALARSGLFRNVPGDDWRDYADCIIADSASMALSARKNTASNPQPS